MGSARGVAPARLGVGVTPSRPTCRNASHPSILCAGRFVKQHTFRAAVWLLGAGSVVALIFILGTSFSEAAGGPTGARAPVPLLPYPVFIALLAVVGLALVAAFVRFLVTLARDPGGRARRRSADALVLVAAVIGALAVVFVLSGLVLSLMEIPEEPDQIALERGEGEGEPEEIEDDRRAMESQADSGEGEPRERTGLGVAIASVVAAALAVAAGLVVWRRYAGRPEADERDELGRLSGDLRRASGRGLERMLDEPDHRRAVVAAYALVEATLERHGYPHGRGDTPLEFMRATLARLAERSTRSDAPDAAHAYEQSSRALLTLTRLYEVAKFSEHPVGERERARAVESLESIATAVAGRADEPGGAL